MSKSNSLGYSKSLDDHLMHYGVKGMKWGKKGKKKEDPPASGGGGGSETDEERKKRREEERAESNRKADEVRKKRDQRTLDALTELLAEEKVDPMQHPDVIARERKFEELRKKGLPGAINETKNPGDRSKKTVPKGRGLFREDLRTEDLIKRSQRRQRAREAAEARKKKNLTHDDIISEELDAFLMHHGVKGMKWGVRKDNKPQGYQGPSAVDKIKSKTSSAKDNLGDRIKKISDSRAKSRKAKAKVKAAENKVKAAENKVKAEENQAVKEARTAEQEAREAGTTRTMTTARTRTSDMTDKELQAVINRMNMEIQYTKLVSQATPKKMSTKMADFAKETAVDFAKQQVRSQIHKTLGRGMGKLFDDKSKGKGKGKGQPKVDINPEPTAPKPKVKRTKTVNRGFFTKMAPKPKPNQNARAEDLISQFYKTPVSQIALAAPPRQLAIEPPRRRR